MVVEDLVIGDPYTREYGDGSTVIFIYIGERVEAGGGILYRFQVLSDNGAVCGNGSMSVLRPGDVQPFDRHELGRMNKL